MLHTGPSHHRPQRSYVSAPAQFAARYNPFRRLLGFLDFLFLLIHPVTVTLETFIRYRFGWRYYGFLNFVAGLCFLLSFLFIAGAVERIVQNVQSTQDYIDDIKNLDPWDPGWIAHADIQHIKNQLNPFRGVFQRSTYENSAMCQVIKYYVLLGVTHFLILLCVPLLGLKRTVTTYHGHSLLLFFQREPPRWIEALVNVMLEPLLAIYMGWRFFHSTEPVVAAWLYIGAFALSVHGYMRHFQILQTDADASDALIEAEYRGQHTRKQLGLTDMQEAGFAEAPAFVPRWGQQAASTLPQLRPNLLGALTDRPPTPPQGDDRQWMPSPPNAAEPPYQHNVVIHGSHDDTGTS